MSERLDTMKWLWYVLVLCSGPAWSPAKGVTVRVPPKDPTTIEAHAKFFQYRHLPTSEDYDQGHRLGSERHFTERHERSRPSTGLFAAKVRWGDKKGGYGEHYWDLNHAGHGHDNDGYDDSDDGSYREGYDNEGDTYEEPSEQSPTYQTEEYDSEKDAKYDDALRAKRAHGKVDSLKDEPDVEILRTKTKTRRHREEVKDEKEEVIQKPEKQVRQKPEQTEQPREKNQVILVVNQKDKSEPNETTQEEQSLHDRQSEANEEKPEQKPYYRQPEPNDQRQEQQPYRKPVPNEERLAQQSFRQTEPNLYVPYEHGAGVRQHHPAELAAASVPRLFLEPTTGHVVDRATGQAYILQPLVLKPNYG